MDFVHDSIDLVARRVEVIATLSDADIVFSHGEGKVCTVMLKSRKSGDFAVCMVDPSRAVITAPNYRFRSEHARLFGSMSPRGVLSVLDWTDRPTAINRYVSLLGEVEDTPGVVRLRREQRY